jgi:hypothetical protein
MDFFNERKEMVSSITELERSVIKLADLYNTFEKKELGMIGIISGYTKQKTNERNALIDLALIINGAMVAFYLKQNKREQMKNVSCCFSD